jgi:hypothetical protein
VLYAGAPWTVAAQVGLLDAVRSGQSALGDVHGMTFWEYLGSHADASATFNALMGGGADAFAPILAVYDFSAFDCLVDVGGNDRRKIEQDAAQRWVGL